MTRSTPFFAILSPGNVLKELSDPAGAVIYTSRFQVGFIPQSLAIPPLPAPAILPLSSPIPSNNERWGSAC